MEYLLRKIIIAHTYFEKKQQLPSNHSQPVVDEVSNTWVEVQIS